MSNGVHVWRFGGQRKVRNPRCCFRRFNAAVLLRGALSSCKRQRWTTLNVLRWKAFVGHVSLQKDEVSLWGHWDSATFGTDVETDALSLIDLDALKRQLLPRLSPDPNSTTGLKKTKTSLVREDYVLLLGCILCILCIAHCSLEATRAGDRRRWFCILRQRIAISLMRRLTVWELTIISSVPFISEAEWQASWDSL